MTGYRRQDLIERHMWRTGLLMDKGLAERAALTVCRFAPGEARDLLEMTGLLHPNGPSPVQPKGAGLLRLQGAAPKLDAHKKRAKIK